MAAVFSLCDSLTMSELVFRQAGLDDALGMAQVRAGDWSSEEFWIPRIRAYLAGDSHPRQALSPRLAYVCLDGEVIVGLIAGHLTRRFGCDGELQWLSVRPAYRGRGVATELLRRLWQWFIERKAHHICVDVQPANETARRFYRSHGADDLKPSWMVWKDIRQPTMNKFSQ